MSPLTAPPGSLFSRSFVALALAGLAYFLAIGIGMLALPLYTTGPVGSDEAGVGLVMGAFGITAVLSRPFVGRLSDSRGRVPLMVAGAMLAGASMAMLPFLDSLFAVVVIRLLQGVAEAAFMVASFALVADLAPPSRLGEAISYNSVGLYVGLALGPALGELLLHLGGYPAAWVGGAVLCGAALGAVLLIREPPHESTDRGHGRFLHLPGVPAALGFLASLVAVGGFTAFVALHSAQIGMSNTSLALVTYGAVVIVGRLTFAKVHDRAAPLLLGTGALFAIACGLVLMASWHTATALLIGAVLMGLGASFSTPAFFAAIFATASSRERGAAAATASLAVDLGLGFGPMVLGLVARESGISAALLTGAAVATLGAAWVVWLAHRQSLRRCTDA